MCSLIIGISKSMISTCNEEGETPLFVAALNELSYDILHLYGGLLVDFAHKKGITPFHLLANKPSAFKSGSHLRWFEDIIYHCE
ncbi:hypothetical protein ACB092_10G201800 [Castanea dentata]